MTEVRVMMQHQTDACLEAVLAAAAVAAVDVLEADYSAAAAARSCLVR